MWYVPLLSDAFHVDPGAATSKLQLLQKTSSEPRKTDPVQPYPVPSGKLT